MERLEEMIRESLEARAGDVEPTPALWDRVEERITRRRRLTVGVWSMAGAAAVLVAAVALPGLLRQPLQPDVADTPPATVVPSAVPTGAEEPTAPAGDAAPSADPGLPGAPTPDAATESWPAVNDADGDGISDVYVAVDGAQGLTLRSTVDDAVIRRLRDDVGREGEGRFDDVAVRPGSTPAFLEVAVSYTGEGFREVRLYTFVEDVAEPAVRIVSIGEDTWPEVAGGVEWDEAGELLAWLGSEGLVVGRASDIERLTPYPEDAFGLRDEAQVLPVDFRGAVVDWAWYESVGQGSFSRAMVTLADGLRTRAVWLRVDAEGRLVIDQLGEVQEGRVVVSDHTFPGWSDGGRSVGLSADGPVIELGWGADGDQSGSLPLGGDRGLASGVWLDVDHGGHIVGKSDGVWLTLDPWTDVSPSTRSLPQGIRRAAFVPRLGDVMAEQVAIQRRGG